MFTLLWQATWRHQNVAYAKMKGLNELPTFQLLNNLHFVILLFIRRSRRRVRRLTPPPLPSEWTRTRKLNDKSRLHYKRRRNFLRVLAKWSCRRQQFSVNAVHIGYTLDVRHCPQREQVQRSSAQVTEGLLCYLTYYGWDGTVGTTNQLRTNTHHYHFTYLPPTRPDVMTGSKQIGQRVIECKLWSIWSVSCCSLFISDQV